jgi:hypothetical protein
MSLQTLRVLAPILPVLAYGVAFCLLVAVSFVAITVGFMVLATIFAALMAVISYDHAHAVPTPVEVKAKSWEVTVPIEQFRRSSAQDWCASVPPTARVLSRESRLYDTQGWGRRRTEVWREWCEYEVEAWVRTRKLSATGDAVTPIVVPVADFVPCKEIGCERTVAPIETYTLQLVDRTTKRPESCTVQRNTWDRVVVGQRVDVGLSPLFGAWLCDEAKW